MAENSSTIELHIGPQGRIVLPASLRRRWGVSPGEVLLAHLSEERLILEKPSHVVQRVKQRFAALHNQPSLADQLIAERRGEANLEVTA